MKSSMHRKSKWLFWLMTLSLLTVAVLPLQSQAFMKREERIRWGFLFNVKDPLGEIDAAGGALNYVSPDWFFLNSEGRLVISKKADVEIVRQLHLREIKVVPFLSNDFNHEWGALALADRVRLTQEITAAVTKFNLDGVNIDIENLRPDQREFHTDFIRLLKTKMPNKHISVSLAANPHNWSGGWHDSYDYAELAKYSDHIVLMSYDLMYYTRYNGNSDSTNGGPVAGEDAVTETVEDLLKRGIPAEKILLGIPFYARIWCESLVDEEAPISDSNNCMHNTSGFALIHTWIDQIVTQPGVSELTHTIDPRTKSDVTTFRVDKKIELRFITLEPGEYSIYHESVESYAYKMALMKRYNLAGYAAWAVGQENPVFWQALGREQTFDDVHLIEREFDDIRNHWSEESVRYGAARSWLSWTDSAQFYPDQEITRAEAAATLRRAGEIRRNDLVEMKNYSDLTDSHWAYDDIQTITSLNLMVGKTAVAPYVFGVNDSMTRAEIATILDRILPEEIKGSYDATVLYRFQDMQEKYANHWANVPLARIVKCNLMGGFGDGTLRPDDPLTRGQLMSILIRVDNLLRP